MKQKIFSALFCMAAFAGFQIQAATTDAQTSTASPRLSTEKVLIASFDSNFRETSFNIYTHSPHLTLTAYAPGAATTIPLTITGTVGNDLFNSSSKFYAHNNKNFAYPVTLTPRTSQSVTSWGWYITISIETGYYPQFNEIEIYAEYEY